MNVTWSPWTIADDTTELCSHASSIFSTCTSPSPHTHTRSFTSFFIIWFSIPFFMRASASNSTGSSLYPSHPPLSPTDSSEWYGVEHPLSALKRRSFTTYMRAIFTRGGKGLAMS